MEGHYGLNLKAYQKRNFLLSLMELYYEWTIMAGGPKEFPTNDQTESC